MPRYTLKIFLLLLLTCLPAFSQIPMATLRRSLARISVTSQDPNFKIPWNPGNVGGGTGAGFVISGQRIMTNAHVVSNAKFITVEREADPKKYVAKIEHVAHDCDLAVLKLEDASFFKDTAALQLGGIPEVETTVSVFGYPIGGDRLSVTQGVVSRIDFQLYTHSNIDSHLTIQIDAAINPGNSGGPVLQGGKVVGVAFQGYSGAVAQNVGYMIPTPVIQRFLKDIEDGHYDRYVDLAIQTFNLQNPAMRKALGLADDGRGVMVGSVSAAGPAASILKPGDVLLSIDGHPIDSDGFVDLENTRVEMPEVVERKFSGDEIKLTVLRDHKQLDVSTKLFVVWPYLIQATAYDTKPRYVVFGGLLFQPLSRDFMEAWDPDDLRVRYMYDYFVTDELYKDRPEVVVLSAILPDPINTYLTDFRFGVLDKVNGTKIKNLKDAAAVFAQPAEQYVIELLGADRPIVLEASAVEAARERIQRRYRVEQEQNLEETLSSR